MAGRRAAVSVCEDVWNDRDFWQRPRYLADPIDAVEGLGAGVLINLSASPFSAGKQAVREEMLGVLARSHGVHVVYVNQVGGNDDLIFDGRSVVLDPDGRVVARAPAFAEAVVVVDLDGAGRRRRVGRRRRRGRDLPRARARHRATTRASAASATCCSACPAASTRR